MDNHSAELLQALKDLRKELHHSRFWGKTNVKKDFSLMVAENEAAKLIYRIEGGE